MMDSEVKTIIAFLFRRSGKIEMDFSEVYLTLSMDLNWFTPDDAKEFVNIAIKQNFLTKKGNLVKPSFDYEKIVVPIGFYPSKQIFENAQDKKEEEIQEQSIFRKIVLKIAKKTSLNEQNVLDKIKEIEKEKNIIPEVAALLVGKKYDVILDVFFNEVENKIFTENEG